MTPDLASLSRAVARRYRCYDVSIEDLHQEAYLVMLEMLHNGISDPQTLQSRTRNHLRTVVAREKRQQHKQLFDPSVENSCRTGLEDLLKYILRKSRLPHDQALVIDYVFWEGMTTRQVSLELAISEDAVRMLKMRALKKLRRVALQMDNQDALSI